MAGHLLLLRAATLWLWAAIRTRGERSGVSEVPSVRAVSRLFATRCKCQACAVCVSPPSPPPSPLPPPPPPSPPELACHSGIHGDASVTQCAPWCSLDSVGKHGKRPLMDEHCEHCKCKARAATASVPLATDPLATDPLATTLL